MRRLAAVAVMTGLAAMPGRAADCPIEHSSYRLRLDPTITARFIKIKKVGDMLSDLAFGVTWQKDHTTFWYTFDSGTDPYINMVSISDPTGPDYSPPIDDSVKRPHGDMQYLALQEDLNFNDRVPRSGMKAPRLILMPRLPEIRLNHSHPEHSFFALSGCSNTAAPELNRPSKAR